MATMSTHRIASAIANHLKKNGLNAEIEHSRRSNSKYVYASIPEDHWWDHWDEMKKQNLNPDKMKTIRISDHLNPATRFGRQSDSNDRAIETDYEIRTDQDNQKNWKDIAHATVSDFSPEMSFLQGKGQIPHKDDGGGITAYHGSPHEFDQFDTSKIGTGEGKQSYGHGLYFAEAEPTARHYQELLSSGNPTLSGRVKSVLAEHNGDENAAKGYIQQAIDYHTSKGNSGDRAFWQNALDQFDDLKNYNKGHMYEVAIDAHPDHFLDWDKPLSEQSFHIGKSIFDARKDNPTLFNVFKPHLEKDSTGMGFYQSLATQHPNGYQGATDFLQRAGIHGIRYLDAGSRNAQGDPTHNYVVFDHNRVSVKRKYAQGGDVEAYGDGGNVGSKINNPMSVFPKPQRMFPEDAPVAGGQYLSMPDKQDMTGHKSAAASIGVNPGGKPYFTASRDEVDETGSPGRGSATAKTNLFKQKAGWKWKDAPEGHEDTNTIVSVEHRGQHHYALNAHFPKGVDLARYENSPSEPRLRPTTRGNVEFGPQAGSILVRGREHPVYHHVIVKNAGGEVDGHFDPSNPDITKAKGGTIDRENVDYKKMPHSRIVEHALGKISAPLPALNPHLMAAIAGRRS